MSLLTLLAPKQSSGVIGSLVSSLFAIGTSTPINLTTQGGSDYWAYDATQTLPNGLRKSGGLGLITVTEYDPDNVYPANQISEPKSLAYQGSDGVPTSSFSVSDAFRMVSFGTTNQAGFKISVPAGTGQRTIRLWLMGYSQNGAGNQVNLSASLSDSSAAVINVDFSLANISSDNYIFAELTYNASSEGQTLDVIWKFNTDTAVRAVHIGAVWLSSIVVPEVVIPLGARLLMMMFDNPLDCGCFGITVPELPPSGNISTPTTSKTGNITTVSFTTESSLRAGVEFGSTTSYGTAVVEDAGTTNTTHSITLESNSDPLLSPHGLITGQTYHLRAVAGVGGTVTSGDITFVA